MDAETKSRWNRIEAKVVREAGGKIVRVILQDEQSALPSTGCSPQEFREEMATAMKQDGA